MQASLGRTTLTANEISQLEVGDIVLLDEPHCYYEQGALSGEVVFHPVRHGVPTIVTRIQDAGPPARVQVKSVHREA